VVHTQCVQMLLILLWVHQQDHVLVGIAAVGSKTPIWNLAQFTQWSVELSDHTNHREIIHTVILLALLHGPYD
jgi:hypothetical protein